ncbi:MAG TPA: T9SS type A sorting domain-containing protein [Chitinophagales bacterium]|nr:T9SS type A sorting domain-containing protein [Chitinophagales bacterium]
MKTLSAIIVIAFFSAAAFAQAGELDSTFSGDGKVKDGFPAYGYWGSVSAIAIQPDGKILVASSDVYVNGAIPNRWTISRYNTDGSFDNDFGYGGAIVSGQETSAVVFSLTVCEDWKIVAVVCMGEFWYSTLRFNSNGTFDTSFSAHTFYNTFNEYAAASQSDEKVVVGGIMFGGEGFMLIRYTSNGDLDSSFDSNGIVNTFIGSESGIHAIAIQPDNKIVAGGFTQTGMNTDWALARYNSNGTLDSSFGTQGIVTTAMSNTTINVIAIQPDGKILASAPGTLTLVRYNSDGSLDTTFGTNGIVTDSSFESTGSFALQVDGKIVAAGATSDHPHDFALIVLNQDGSIDSSFGTNGLVTTDFGSNDYPCCVAIAPDRKIVVGGNSSEIELARYLSEFNVGILSFSAPQSSPLVYPNPIQQNETLEYTLTKDQTLTITLYDASGKMVQSFITNENRTAGELKEQLKMNENLAVGNYMLTISNGSRSVSVKVTKQ